MTRSHTAPLALPLLALALAACVGEVGPVDPGETTGTAVLALSLVPPEARCLVVTVAVAGAAPEPRSFSLTPGSPATFALRALPVGTAAFSAKAFTTPCAASAAASPEWASPTVMAQVQVGGTAWVALTLELVAPDAGSAVVTIDFQVPPARVTELVGGVVPMVRPTGIATGPDGNLWVTAPGSNAIVRLSPAGAATAYDVPRTGAADPFAIAAGSDGNLWFTLLTMRVSAVLGRLTPGGELSEVQLPPRMVPGVLAAAPDGTLWFTSHGPDGPSLGILSPATGGLIEIALPTLAYPSWLAVGPAGTMWYSDHQRSLLVELTLQGSVLTEVPVQTAAGGVVRPGPLAFGAGGTPYFIDVANDLLCFLYPDLSVGVAPTTRGGGLTGLVTGPDGNVWYSLAAAGRVGVVRPDGTVSEFPVLTPGARPSFLTPGPDGALWFTEPGADRVGRLALP